jgi:predicted RNA-binding protein
MSTTNNHPQKYWIVVASKDHVSIGKKLGVVQANHGKASGLRRMSAGDYIIFYSSKNNFEKKDPYKKFTAIAKVKAGNVYNGYMSSGSEPYRRDVEFIPSKEADIIPLIPKLTFIRKKESWGFVFRFGLFEIPKEDFETIARNMNPKIKGLFA